MRTAVVATAGHVDHGKSTLVRALTGTDPDRWEQEQRRGLTIDLGFAWTQVGDWQVSFVDVPGHERYIGNALAGLGPAPVVCFVVAADEGWNAQSADHRDAVAALGIARGLLVLTRADLAGPDELAATRTRVREEFSGTNLAGAPIVVTAAARGQGLTSVRTALASVLDRAPEPARPRASDDGLAGGVRLWIDRAFSITGAGTVVTGTLTAGTIAAGEDVTVHTASGRLRGSVRSIQTRGQERRAATGADRVALNLRGIAAGAVRRGDVLLSAGAAQPPQLAHAPPRAVSQVDVQRVWGELTGGQGRAYLGSTAVAVHVRPLAADLARVTFTCDLPILPGDRLALGASHARGVSAGARVLDINPLRFDRRGAARRRAGELAPLMRPAGTAGREPSTPNPAGPLITASGAISDDRLAELWIAPPQEAPGHRHRAGWWFTETTWSSWSTALTEALARERARDPLSPGLAAQAAANQLGLPTPALLPELAASAGLDLRDGLLTSGAGGDLGELEPAIEELERRLRAAPFAAPEADELADLGLGVRELAAAQRAGRLLRIAGGVVLLPDAPALAVRKLTELPGPFTVSQARAQLGTSRRVALPLLELLDRRGWTRRSGNTREIIRRP